MVLILPFAMRLENDGQETVAADDLELCLVLSLVEAEREKGGGFLKKKTAESISFVSKVFWPLFVMKRPEENKYVILDMLGIFEQTFEYKTTPDIPGIIRGLEEHKPSHARCEEYIALLKSHEDSLRDFAGTVVTTLTGCLT
ncbi:MAG: hypothetical protein HXS43_11315, partial [Theionarchaea archaeon]|nr:hypothetical protein [Theionarchaea archaeon]